MSTNPSQPRVIIIGAGFGGLYAAKKLAKQPVNVLVIDRQNFHLFSPLLYQVATSGLEPGEITSPVRGMFRGKPNIEFMLGDVRHIDTQQQTVEVKTNGSTRLEPYDYLIVAAGSRTHYFGMETIQRASFGLKTLSDAVVLRNHVLKCFEKAAWTDDPAEREALTTMVVVGGGPTGLETAGAFQELIRHVLDKEYTEGDHPLKGRVILVEMMDHLLDPYPQRLQEAARRQLESLGIEVILGDSVIDATPRQVTLKSGRVIPAYTLIWSAGVKASPLGAMLGVELTRSGQVPIEPTTEVIGLNNVFVVGDLAFLKDKTDQPYPMLIPVAKQQGMLAAKNILRRIADQPLKTFKYHDRGIMATIGRTRAVAWIFYRIQLSGALAWLSWLGLHLITLIGFRNRLNVLVNWTWNYWTYDRSVRIILEHRPHETDRALFAGEQQNPVIPRIDG